MSTVILEKKDGIATITLNRPNVMNSINLELAEDTSAALTDAQQDEDIRVLIVTGKGKAFCAGGDINCLIELSSDMGKAKHLADILGGITYKMVNCPKPVIGMINGVAAGAGANLLLACDITFAAASFRFSQSFVKVGLAPDAGGHYLLPRAVGLAKAKEIMFTGKLLDAAEALDLGLVNHVVADELLAKTTYEFAAELVAAPPLALSRIKQYLNIAQESSLGTVMELEGFGLTTALASADGKEGLTAFTERRKPKFTGK